MELQVGNTKGRREPARRRSESGAPSWWLDLAFRWESQTLGGTGVSHIDHLRVAWVLVRRHGATDAEERLVEGTRKGCNHYGVPERFDERLTRRWAVAVSDVMGNGVDVESFDDFIARNPEPQRGGLFGRPHDLQRE